MELDLKREFSLATLTVALRTRGNSAVVELRLETSTKVGSKVLWEKPLEAELIGLGPRVNSATEFARLPPATVEEIRQALVASRHHGPLWLHLVRPYGLLGALCWEQLLDSLGCPVLRLPAAPAGPALENSKTLTVALCASRPRAKESFDVPTTLVRITRTLIEAAPNRQLQIHVFSDLECTRSIERELNDAGLLDTVVFLAPAPQTAESRNGPDETTGLASAALTSPWLQWMASTLRGKAVDVVHFLCHGYLADCNGSLAFAASPSMNDDLNWSRFVGSGELGRFLLVVGAWSLAFTSPRGNYSPAGLRTLADQLAQVRPGPVLHHVAEADPDFVQLCAANGFLYGHARLPRQAMPAIALSCQPAPLKAAGKTERPQFLGSRSPSDPTDATTQPLPQVSDLIATAYRFVEQKEFDIQRGKGRAGTRSAPELDGVARGVADIRQALQSLARKGKLR